MAEPPKADRAKPPLNGNCAAQCRHGSLMHTDNLYEHIIAEMEVYHSGNQAKCICIPVRGRHSVECYTLYCNTHKSLIEASKARQRVYKAPKASAPRSNHMSNGWTQNRQSQPKWMQARFAGNCPTCGTAIQQGGTIFLVPAHLSGTGKGVAYCPPCGQRIPGAGMPPAQSPMMPQGQWQAVGPQGLIPQSMGYQPMAPMAQQQAQPPQQFSRQPGDNSVTGQVTMCAAMAEMTYTRLSAALAKANSDNWEHRGEVEACAQMAQQLAQRAHALADLLPF